MINFNKKSITVVGGITQDIIFYTDQALLINNKKDLLRQKLIAFEYGAKLHSPDVHFTYGGGAANTAVGLANLGLSVKIMAAVGGDAIGHEMIYHLQNKKVNTSLVQRKLKVHSAMSMIVTETKTNEHVIFAFRGANDNLALEKKQVHQIHSAWAYIHSLAGQSANTISYLMQYLMRQKMFVAWNPGGQEIKWGIKKLAKYLGPKFVLLVNRDEALELATAGGYKVANNIRALFKIIHRDQMISVITDGPRGAYVYDGKKVYYQKATNHKPINTTGAGDAFGSGFVAGLIKYNFDLKAALNLALLNSGSVVSQIGAQSGLLHENSLKIK